MKIALVSATYPAKGKWGGIGSYTCHLAHGLCELGHRVRVITSEENIPATPEDGIEVLGAIRSGATAEQARADVADALAQAFAEGAADIVELPEHDAPGLLFQLRNPGVPTVVKLHGDSELCFYGAAPRWKQLAARIVRPRALMRRIQAERDSAERAHAVVAPSEWMRKSCLRRGWALPPDSLVIGNPFCSRLLDSESGARDYSDARVLWLARFDARKGITLLPEIATRVWRAFPRTEFHLIGQTVWDRDWGKWLRSRMGDETGRRVLIHGGLPYADVLRCLGSYSLAVFASTWESFCYTQAECMWSGMACVNASGTGASELGVHGREALNIPRSPASIADALCTLLGDAALRRRIGESGSAAVRGRFGHIRIASEMESVYAGVLARQGSTESACLR